MLLNEFGAVPYGSKWNLYNSLLQVTYPCHVTPECMHAAYVTLPSLYNSLLQVTPVM